MKKCTLEIVDEVNARFHNLDILTRRKLVKELSYFLPYARHTPSFKLGRWNGMISYCDVGGRSYINLLDRLLPIVENAGYEIELADHRDFKQFTFEKVVADSYSHVVWPKGHVCEGEPIILRDYQVEIINKFLANQQGVQEISTGAGKAQPLHSKIKVPGGWKTMGDMKIGDIVTAANGTNSMVTGVYPQGKTPTYRFTFSDGRQAEASDEHLWNVTTKSQPANWRAKTTKEIIKWRNNIKQDIYIPLCNPADDNDIELPLDPYFLGVLLGDGTFRHGHVGISTSDKFIVEYIKNILDKDYELIHKTNYDYSIRIKKDRYPAIKNAVGFVKKVFHKYRKILQELGLDHKLSHEKFVPNVYLNASTNQRKMILRGLLDSDGWIDKSNAIFTSTSNQLANDVLYLARSLGFKSSIKQNKNRTYEYNNETRPAKDSYDVRIMGYVNDLFLLERKQNTIKESTKTKRAYIKIVDIEYIGDEECQCIMIDHNDHLYVTNDFVVTHNTLVTAALSHKVEAYGRTIVVVPSKQLVTQTEADYKNLGLDVGVFFGDRKEYFKTHTICTWQSLEALNKKSKTYDPDITLDDFIEDVVCIIIDEAHGAKAEALKKLMTTTFKNVPLRWGMTGTIPEEKHEEIALFAVIGNLIHTVTAKELQDQGVLSNLHVNVLQLDDPIRVFKNYQQELTWLSSDKARLRFISEHIIEQTETGNCLILVQRKKTGQMLQDLIPDSVYIDGDVKVKARQDEYDEVRTSAGKVIIATAGIAAVGIDVPRIFNLYLIEPGKSFVRVIQSIGRGIRKAKDKDYVNIFDITSTCKYSKRHLTKRKKFYKNAEYPFTISKIKY